MDLDADASLVQSGEGAHQRSDRVALIRTGQRHADDQAALEQRQRDARLGVNHIQPAAPIESHDQLHAERVARLLAHLGAERADALQRLERSRGTSLGAIITSA